MPRSVHIASRVDSQTLLERPESVLQQLSLKIMERRQQLIDELVGSNVPYETPTGIRYGRIERVEDDAKCVVIHEGQTRVRVSFKRIEVS